MLGKRSLESLLIGSVLLFTLAAWADTGTDRYDAQIRAAVSRQLRKSEFNHVRASVNDGAVTLQGNVALYKQKLDAEKKVRKQDHVTSVNNQIQVAGVTLPDSELHERLAKALAYDRYGYGHVFNVLNIGVNGGVVTLAGEVRTPVDLESALGIVETTPGVKGMVDQVKVAPVSNFDDGLRIRLARAIYGDSELSRYAMDPAAPIRILVDNGHVGLYGTVDNNMDRQIAFMRASEVFGAFSVENHLATTQGVAR